MNSEEIARKIRRRSLELVFLKKASHIGGSLSVTDILAVLYVNYLNLSLKEKSQRDRLFYSKGHSCVALYSTLELFDFFDGVKYNLNTFSDDGSIFTSHVTHNVPGVEISTGSLGHALPIAAGVAFAGVLRKEPWRTFCILSDGELNEGSNWEAIMFSSHHDLKNLIIIIDFNKIQSFGRIEEVINLEPLKDKFISNNCTVIEINGHDHVQIKKAIDFFPSKGPMVIIAHTIKGKGISFMEDKLEWHYKSPNQKEFETAIKELGY
jgi:transketolase